MDKMSMILVVFLVIFANMNYACNQFKKDKCTSVRKFAISEAGPDIPRICKAERYYINCLSSSGCQDNAVFKQMVENIQEMCSSDGGSMVTVSILTMVLAFVALLIQ